jgi:branched-chain amino acid transport system permease protein
MINMAHGLIFALSGYGAWFAAQYVSTNGAVVLLAGIVTGMLVGMLIGVLAFLTLYDKPNYVVRSLIATLAISLLGQQFMLWAFGPYAKPLPKVFGNGSFHVGSAVMSAGDLGAILTTVVVLLLVLIWTKRTRRGLEIRAMMRNPEGAALVGIGLRSTAMAVMAVTGGLAGLAAVLLSQTYFVSPFSGLAPLLKGMIVALAGGLGSIPGAIIAAILVGGIEATTAIAIGGQFVLITQFLFIIVVLLIRPRGIAGIIETARE